MGSTSAERPKSERIERHVQRDQTVLGYMNNHVTTNGVRGHNRQREKQEGAGSQCVLDGGVLHRFRGEPHPRSDMVNRGSRKASLQDLCTIGLMRAGDAIPIVAHQH